MAGVLLNAGKACAAEQEAVFATRALHKFVVLTDVQVRERVGAPLSRSAISKTGSARPQVFTAIRLKAIHAHFCYQIFALFEPPINGFRIGEIGYQAFFEPGRAYPVRRAIRFHHTQVVFQPVLFVQFVLALVQGFFWHAAFEGGVLP